jgi:hypothetical protein
VTATYDGASTPEVVERYRAVQRLTVGQ